MDPEEVIEYIKEWLYEGCIEVNLAPENGFFVEEFEHAAIIRWGSKKGDFPQLGYNVLSGTHSVIISGEKLNDKKVVADLESNFDIDMEQHAYRHFLEVLMKDFEDGYNLNGIEAPNGDLFNISVERIRNPPPEEKH